jgi:alpha-1,2-mannosyltransferase
VQAEARATLNGGADARAGAARQVPWDRLLRLGALITAALFFLTSLTAWFADQAIHYGQLLTWYDLNVYNDAGLITRQMPSILYTWQFAPSVKFTYTPFAAILFASQSFIPLTTLRWLMTGLSLLAIPLAAWLTLGALGRRGIGRAGVALAVGGLALWTEPVLKSLQLGQIEPLLMLLIVWDLTRPATKRWQGVGVGIAAGIKLVPAIFIPYLLLAGKKRQAAVATVTFLVTMIIGFIVLPGQSAFYWLTGYFTRPGRTGGVDSLVNQSLLAVIARASGGAGHAQAVWLPIALAVAAAGLVAGAALSRTGRPVHGMVLVGITSVLVSPISWDHHWVWIVPLLALLAGVALQRRGWVRWCSFALLIGTAAVYGAWPWWYTGDQAFVPERGLLAWAVPPPLIYQVTTLHGWQLLFWNLFVAVGSVAYLALLVLAFLAWRRRKRPSVTPPAGPPSTPGAIDALLARADQVLRGEESSARSKVASS